MFAGFLVVGGCALAWRTPPELRPPATITLAVPIMTMEQYGDFVDTHPRPYVYEISAKTGAVLMFGSEHVKDPKDAMIVELRERARAFEPTVVMIEGRLGFHMGTTDGAIRKFGEPAAARALARELGAKAYTWEPDRETEIAMMLEEFPKEKVALMYILRPYFGNLRHGKPSDPDAALERTRRKRTKWTGLEGTFASVAEIDAVWKRDYSEFADWRDTSDEWGWPAPLVPLTEFNGTNRTTHLARCILDQISRGERVLVVAGLSHAVRIEQTLHESVNASPE